MKSNQIIQLIILLVGISSCHRQEREHKVENANHVISKDSLPTKTNQTLNSNNEIDTIQYDYENSPQNLELHINILTTGVFHSDEIDENADKQNWIGLFKNKTKFYLAETKIITKRVNDSVLDAENEKTGWKVETTNKDTSIILIQKLNYLNNRVVQQYDLPQNEIFPGDTLKFKFQNNEYLLFAKGKKIKVQDNPKWHEVQNYELFIAITQNGQYKEQLIVEQSGFEDEMIDIIFAGDIDGDSNLDLIIDTSGHYNETIPTLYLSKPSENGQILKAVGSHASVGC